MLISLFTLFLNDNSRLCALFHYFLQNCINFLLNISEITAFSDRYAEFEKLNTEVLGVSIDSVVIVSNSASSY